MKRTDNLNSKNAIIVTYNGETHRLITWSRITGIYHGTLYKRYAYGDRGERLFREVRKKRQTGYHRGNW